MLGSALENRFHAELGHAAVGISREDANEMVKTIVGKYAGDVSKDGGPWGYIFNEIHDQETLEIKRRFLEVMENVKNQLSDMGLDFQY